MEQLQPNPRHITNIGGDDLRRLVEVNPTDRTLAEGVNHCITCQGSGYFRWYSGGVPGNPVTDYECNCEEQVKLYLHLLNSGLGLRYQRLGWADAVGVAPSAERDLMRYLTKAERYVHAGIGLVLHGDRGTGKSLASALWLKGMIALGFDGYFVTFADMLDLYQNSWRRDEEKRYFERRVTNARLLVIDDIGRENVNRGNVASEAVDRVIRNRVSAERPTVITTNKTPDDLGEIYSLNALSLLSSCTRPVHFLGEDFRPQSYVRADAEIDLGVSRPVVLA